MRTYLPGESFSPEFTSLSNSEPEALEFGLIHGAAKLACVLSDGSFDAIDRPDFQFMSLGDLLVGAPELVPVFEIFGVTPEKTRDSRIRLSRTGLPPVQCELPRSTAHQDDDEVAKGVTLIIPTSGPEAYFGVADEDFDIFKDDDSGPDHLWSYGRGDIMIVRQDIDIIDDKEVGLDRAWHGGAGALSRCLSVVDIAHSEMQLSFDTGDLLAILLSST